MSCIDVITWLEHQAVRITFQQLPPSRRRRKNRCVLEYRDLCGELQVCAGADLLQVVWRAMVRSTAARGT
jgi:hypothetical protein